MWLLLLVFFSGPMQIERVEILETHWTNQKCVERTVQAEKVGLPPNSNIGCIYVGSIKNT
jgi:3-hydroxyacyl-CoA dehydrogenase